MADEADVDSDPLAAAPLPAGQKARSPGPPPAVFPEDGAFHGDRRDPSPVVSWARSAVPQPVGFPVAEG